MSMTMYSYLAEADFDDISYKYLLLRLNDPTNQSLTDQIAKDLEDNVRRKVTVSKTYKEVEDNNQVKKILDLIFYVAIFVMMFLCFFSLVASMSANLYE